MRPLRMLALVPKPVGVSPGQRFRIEQWEPILRERHGIEIEYAPFESPELTRVLYASGGTAKKASLVLRDFVKRRGDVLRARRYDVAFVYREASLIGPAVYERVLGALGVPFVFDFDDAIWNIDPAGANGLFARLHFPAKTGTLCRIASAVTVGNRFLAAWAEEHGGRVFVAPTSIELARFPLQPTPPADAPFTVVWTGTHTTLRHLELVRGALVRLAKERPVRLRIIADRPMPTPPDGVETTFQGWRAASEAEDLAPAHVGVMPLVDDAFARGKCAAKALQYMAAGIPTVVSPVGVNADIVTHRENGLLATTEDEWLDGFRALAGDPALRARLRERGRATVEAGFSSVASAAKMAEAVKAAVLSPRTPW